MTGAGATGGVHGGLLFMPLLLSSVRYPALAGDQQQEQRRQQAWYPKRSP